MKKWFFSKKQTCVARGGASLRLVATHVSESKIRIAASKGAGATTNCEKIFHKGGWLQ